MVEQKNNIVYPLIYLLVTLVLILPVTTTIMERAFSTINILENRLQNRMGYQCENDELLLYVEKDIFDNNETII